MPHLPPRFYAPSTAASRPLRTLASLANVPKSSATDMDLDLPSVPPRRDKPDVAVRSNRKVGPGSFLDRLSIARFTYSPRTVAERLGIED